MSEQKLIPEMKGYKATDTDMRCRGYQFALDEWFQHEGELKECESGFHFCEHLSGVWNYYSKPGTRVWEIEAEDVLDKAPEPGATIKRVARRIRFIREIPVTGNGNAGDRNTGNWNTGNGNAGNRNAGDGNAANHSSGFFNQQEPEVTCFDEPTGLTHSEFISAYPEYSGLVVALAENEPIDPRQFARLPNITPAKLQSLHKKHIAGRKE